MLDRGICSLSEGIEAVAPHLPAALVTPDQTRSIAAVARWFPDGLSQQFGFECRLGAAAAPTDFVLLVSPENEGREILAGLHPAVRLPEELRAHPTWERISDFASRWARPGSVLHRNVHGLWLELDVAGPPAGVPVPGVFFEAGSLPAAGSSGVPPQREDWVLAEALPLLRGTEPPPRLARLLSDLLDGSRSGAQVLHIGLFPGRGIDAVRLFLHPFSRQEFLSRLPSLGWEGDRDEIEALAAPLAELVDRIYLDLDVGEGVYPGIGIECHFEGRPQPSREPRWALLLNYLVDRGLCAPAKARALLEFPGSSVEDFLYRRVFYRGLHHIKVSCRPGRAPEAKAYIGCKHYPEGWLTVGSSA